MAGQTTYRLICYESHLARERCFFDDEVGRKKCEDPSLHVRIKKGAHDTFVVFHDPSGKLRKLTLHRDMNTSSSGVWFKRKGNRFEDQCQLSPVDPAQEATVSGMSQTHPATWRLIDKRLDDLTSSYSWKPETFRKLADQFVRRGYGDQHMFAELAPDAMKLQCYKKDRENIPRLPKDNPPDLTFSTSFKECRREELDYDQREISEYAVRLNLQQDRNCFWNTLVHFVPQTPYRPFQGRAVELLDIGCGTASGAVPLVEYFQKLQRASHHNIEDATGGVRYTGIDESKEAIENARSINPQAFDFVIAEAADFLDARPEKKYDVILLRHPGPINSEYGSLAGTWIEIVRRAFQHLSDNGILMITNYQCDEYRLFQYLLERELKARVFVSGVNPFSFEASLDRDYYLIIVGK